jgi:hypothetical protein
MLVRNNHICYSKVSEDEIELKEKIHCKVGEWLDRDLFKRLKETIEIKFTLCMFYVELHVVTRSMTIEYPWFLTKIHHPLQMIPGEKQVVTFGVENFSHCNYGSNYHKEMNVYCVIEVSSGLYFESNEKTRTEEMKDVKSNVVYPLSTNVITDQNGVFYSKSVLHFHSYPN